MEDGDVLLHGDFYPGSWVRSKGGPKVIDPEFAFFGHAEYDVGVLRAHLILAGYREEFSGGVYASYDPVPGFDQALADGFAGIEIMRRLIGVAQLSLSRSLEEKQLLLERSVRLVLGSD
jgi:5-methylthioribose kinase